jgi:hypothetical protein
VRRLITLGTPHGGSFAPVQALRGTYPVVRRLAALDRLHDAETLAAEVFSSFPSIYQMLPHTIGPDAVDLFDPANWPAAGPSLHPELLRDARAFAGTLASADQRYIAIVGTHQRTVTGLHGEPEEFGYEISSQGDGTVPVASARLSGVDTYYVRCEHSGLPRSERVGGALIELLRSGGTGQLTTRWNASRAGAGRVSDTELRGMYAEKVDWSALSPRQRREYLNRLNLPPPQYRTQRSG